MSSTAPLAALLASHPEECAAVVAVLVVDDFNGLHPDDIEAGLPQGMRVTYPEMMAILGALESAGIAENCQPDWQLLNRDDYYSIARMGAAAWLAARCGLPAPMTRAQAVALAETIEGPRVAWDRLDVGALVRHLLLGDSLDQRPHVARVVEGGRKRAEREATWAAKCLANETDRAKAKGEQR